MPQTLLAALMCNMVIRIPRLEELEHTQPQEEEAVEFISTLDTAIVQVALVIIWAGQAVLVVQEEALDQMVDQVLPRTEGEPLGVVAVLAAEQCQEIQISLGRQQDQDLGASHEHHIFI
jgi:hypothetical protein